MSTRSRSRRRLFLASAVTLVAATWLNAHQSADSGSFESLARASLAQLTGHVTLPGLARTVEVLRDEWGIPHIYAQTTDDLFFAQGFVTAQDRLWQMELSRRVGQGRVAELVGPSALSHDRLVRTLKFRGPWDDQEWNNYHPEGRRIFNAYARGINAFLTHARDNLPVEFKLTGITPEPWRPEELLVRARVGAAVSGAREELRLAQAVARLGAAEANRRARPDPWGELVVPDGLDVAIITDDIIRSLDGDLYGTLPRPELLPPYRSWPGAARSHEDGVPELWPGSNNWAVRGTLTASGKAIMVDDPHRQVTSPALRYIVHLSAPGWNVAGATEPGLPGVIRGHNGRLAWGRTATGTDEADVFVEELNPSNPNEIRRHGRWEALLRVSETIAVRGEAPRTFGVKIGPHGPIFYEDHTHHRAYALRSSLQEPGTAEYLGGLRLDQASSAHDCLTLSAYLRSPATNLVCADGEGNIAFRVSAAAPRRRGWDGRLPVPGTGRFEWDGFRTDLPEDYNPPRGWIATANNNIHPPGYSPPLFFTGQPPYRRYERISAMVSGGSQFTVDDFMRMLRDSLDTEASAVLQWFRGWSGSTPDVERARALVASWDAAMSKGSAPAAIYATWRRLADLTALREAPPPERERQIDAGLARALQTLTQSQGPDWAEWRWGRIHRSVFRHPLVAAFDLPTVERSGGAGTVNATGAVYRLITDFADLDRSMVTIAPGQSAQPGSPFYGNLLSLWGEQEFFPLLYSRAAVEARTRFRLTLTPGRN